MFEELKIKLFGIQTSAIVTTHQLDKLIAREFPDCIDKVHLKLDRVESNNPNGKNRISAGIIKLANKDFALLDLYIQLANADYRDILSQAEYPRYSKLDFENFEKTNMKKIYLNDWKEYSKWLNE